jgi:hypothetical protein
MASKRPWLRWLLGWGFGNAAWIITTKLVFAGAVAVISGFTAVVDRQPFGIVVAVTLVVFVAVVWGVNGVLWAFQKGTTGRAASSLPVIQEESPAPVALPPQPHDRDKKYNADLTYEVIGQGRYRYLVSGLREDVGNGWDLGARLEIELPSKQIVSGGGWQGLDTPEMRRLAGRGGGAQAEAEGPYVIRWRSIPAEGYDSEVMAEERIVLPPTAPLEGWRARNLRRGDEMLFLVEPDSSSRGPLHGFKCEIVGPTPGSPFVADDDHREKTFFDLPSPKERREFVYPDDFVDASRIRDLYDGDYTVYWTAWQPDDGSHGRLQLDVARDGFSVNRATGIVPSGTKND